jgi:hypothetical protein
MLFPQFSQFDVIEQMIRSDSHEFISDQYISPCCLRDRQTEKFRWATFLGNFAGSGLGQDFFGPFQSNEKKEKSRPLF